MPACLDTTGKKETSTLFTLLHPELFCYSSAVCSPSGQSSSLDQFLALRASFASQGFREGKTSEENTAELAELGLEMSRLRPKHSGLRACSAGRMWSLGHTQEVEGAGVQGQHEREHSRHVQALAFSNFKIPEPNKTRPKNL